MGKLFTLDQSTDVQEVGSLGAFLAHAVREGMAVVDGFILPIDCGLQDGVSNELHRAFEQLGTPTVILRASLIDNFTDGEWYPMHCQTERHHLNERCPDDVSLIDVIEMICDWQAVSFMFKGNILSWYENEAIDEKECFNANTRQIVDYIMYQLLA